MRDNVLLPDGETVIMCSAYTHGKAYHTRECSHVKHMSNQREVDISVARWKGVKHCARCQRIEATEGDR